MGLPELPEFAAIERCGGHYHSGLPAKDGGTKGESAFQ
jgi:hypothetical protein